jgi:hypothetical protein
MFSQKDVNKRKVFSITMVINEEDIIESFVRYHTNILDGMVIWDIGSADNTPYILSELEKEGLPIYIFRESAADTIDCERIPKLLQYALEKFDPDFIFLLDPDEFLFSSKDNHPRSVIDSLDLNKVYYVKSITYVPQDTDDNNERFIPKKIHHASSEEFEKYYKVALSKDIIIKHHLRFTKGNHDIQSMKNTNGMILKENSTDLRIAHFPIRSSEQIMSKVMIGWINNLSRSDRNPGEAFHWELFYNKIKKDRDLFKKNFPEIVTEYLFDDDQDSLNLILRPLDLLFCKDISLKYTDSKGTDPIRNLLENCEILALKHAKLEKQLLKK